MRMAEPKKQACCHKNDGDGPAKHISRQRESQHCRKRDCGGNRKGMAKTERQQCPPHGSALAFLHSQSNGKQPTHGWIDAMKGAE